MVRQDGRFPPISLRVSVTDRCQLRCVYCTPAGGVRRFPAAAVLRDEEILAFVRLLRTHFDLGKVHLTGGEPLLRRGIAALAAALAREGGADLALTTNGQRLGDLAPALRRAGLGRVNVTLNTLRPAVFRALSGGGALARTLDGVEAARRAGLRVKINATVLRGLNDGELIEMAQYGMERGLEVRFIELMPIGVAARHHARWFVPSSAVLDRLGERFILEPLPRRLGSSCRQFEALDPAGRRGVVSVLSPCTRPFCGDCRRLRLTARGELVGCLAAGGREDILGLLRGADGPEDEKVLESVRTVMRRKRQDTRFSNPRCMVQVGG